MVGAVLPGKSSAAVATQQPPPWPRKPVQARVGRPLPPALDAQSKLQMQKCKLKTSEMGYKFCSVYEARVIQKRIGL